MTSGTDITALLRAPDMASALLADAPAWLWDTGGGRILLASAAGVEFFGEPDLQALLQRDFGKRWAEATQLERVYRSLPGDGSPRLSLVRFFVGFRDVTVPCQCRRIGEAGSGLMLVVAPGGPAKASLGERAAALLAAVPGPAALAGPSGEIVRNAAASRSSGFDESGSGGISLMLPEGAHRLILAGAAAVPDDAGPASTDGPDTRGPEVTKRSDEAVGRADGVEPAAAPAVAGNRGTDSAPAQPRRFTFQLDADGCFTDVGAGFAAIVGPRSADIVGKSVSDLGDHGIDADGALVRALGTQDTWSDVRVDWPTDSGGRAHLRMSALPRFGEGRAFAGFRGFADVLAVVPGEGDPEAESEPEDLASPPRDVSGADAPAGDAGSRSRPNRRRASAASDTVKLVASNPAERALRPEDAGRLNDQERTAFEAIATALGAHWESEAVSADQASAAAADVRGPADEAVAAAARTSRAETTPATSTAQAGSPADNAGDTDTLLRDVLDRVPLGLAVVRDERILVANRAFLELFDYPDLDDLEIAGGLGALLEGHGEESVSDTAVVARRREGDRFAVEARLGRTPWIDGPAMLMSVREARNEADRTDTEDALDADADTGLSMADLRAVVDAAVDGVLVLDEDATVVSTNSRAAKLFGSNGDELVGAPFSDLIDDQDRPAVAELLASLKADMPALIDKGLELSLVTEDGPLPALLTVSLLGERDEEARGEGSRARFCAVLRDISDWKDAEADLVAARKRAEKASSQKSDFLAKMSHEIRTPLNAIIGFSEVMQEERFGPLGNDRYRDYVKDIRESGEHLMSLVNDLLDLSKVEAGKLDLSFTGVKLNELAEQSVAIMEQQASRERIIVRTNLWPSLPAVVADIRSVRQVLLNLLSNAIKFTPPGGQVILSTVLAESGDVFLRIRDTGPGMSESDVAVALEPFRQLPVSPSGSERGTGLGLPLAKALVEANRASFDLRSKVGEGTLVEVCFPQARVLSE